MLMRMMALSGLLLVGDPSLPAFSPADFEMIAQALTRLQEIPDPVFRLRVEATLTVVKAGGPIGIRDMPIVGMALSRGSADPVMCGLLRRIEASAACVK